MAQYINKTALVAEIERRIKERDFQMKSGCWVSSTYIYEDLLDFIDTLEVEEVDLDKEIELTKGDYEQVDVAWNNDFDYIARHFFELGTKAQSKDMIEALRTEYEKGRADVIADTLSWLANVWPQYCSNPNIIDAYKEGVVKD